MRVATYNVENGRAIRSNWHAVSPVRASNYWGRKEETLKRIGAFLREQEVDVVLLQELDGGSPWARVPQIELVKGAGDFEHGWYVSCETMLGLVHQGNGIVSRVAPVPDCEPRRYFLPGGIERRGALEVRLAIDGTPVSFITTHLSMPVFGPLSAYHRGQQFDFLAALVRDCHEEGPVVIGGDLNTLKYDSKMKKFLQETGLDDHFPPTKKTHHSLKPRYNLDHLLVSPGLGVRNERVMTGVVFSDHLPLVADLYVR